MRFQGLENVFVATTMEKSSKRLQDLQCEVERDQNKGEDVHDIPRGNERLHNEFRAMEQEMTTEKTLRAQEQKQDDKTREKQIQRNNIATVQSECEQLCRSVDQLRETMTSFQEVMIMNKINNLQSEVFAEIKQFRGEMNQTIKNVLQTLEQQRESMLRMESKIDEKQESKIDVSGSTEEEAKQDFVKENGGISTSDAMAKFKNLSALKQSSFQAGSTVIALTCFKLGAKQYVASGQATGEIKIWSIDNNCLSTTLTGHTSFVWSLTVFERDNIKYLVSGGNDKTIKIWDLGAGCLVATLSNHSGVVYALTTYQQGSHRFLVSGSGDRSVKVWNLETHTLVDTLQGHTGWVHAVTVYERNNVLYLATGSGDKTVKIWNLRRRALVTTLTGHSCDVFSLAVLKLNNGAVLASGDAGGIIRLWDVDSHDSVGSLDDFNYAHSDVWVLSVVKCDGKVCLVSGSGDGSVKIWDIDDQYLVKTLALGDFVKALTSFQHEGSAYLVAGGKKFSVVEGMSS